MGRDYWAGLVEWLKEQALARGYVSEDDFELFRVVDTAEEAMEAITGFFAKYRKEMVPNF